MVNLALTYWNQERWKEAKKLQIQAMETMKPVRGEDHADTLIIMANLVATYWKQKRWKEAAELEVHVMETRKRVLSEERAA
ncbi:hypothetical protein LTR85_012245 [Meristemomyces frigidus]|nr:hypothetical protein LTR85_012245 [Meristemomyces frigidus]